MDSYRQEAENELAHLEDMRLIEIEEEMLRRRDPNLIRPER